MYKIDHNGEIMFVNSLVGHEDAQVLATNVPEPTDEDLAAEHLSQDVIGAEIYSVDMIEQLAESAMRNHEPRPYLQTMLTNVWREAQFMKIVNQAGMMPADLEARRRMFPTIMAIQFRNNATLPDIITAIENLFWPKIRDMALAHANMLIAINAVITAPTVDEKIDIVRNFSWDD